MNFLWCKVLAGLIFLVSTEAIHSSSSGSGDYRRVETEFGYVLVDRRDIDDAVREGNAVRSKAESVLGLDNIQFAIVEEGSIDANWGRPDSGGLVTYPWPFPHGTRRFNTRPAVHVLRHEIAHDLFARYLVSTSTKGQYGTDAPDWLDEMAALAFESSQGLQSYRRSAKEIGQLSLEIILRSPHPESGAPVSVEPGQTFASDAPSSSQTIPYYATICNFYDFLVEKTQNERIVLELAVAFNRGENLEAWLLGRLGYSAPQDSLRRLDEDFQNWALERGFTVQNLQAVKTRASPLFSG